MTPASAGYSGKSLQAKLGFKDGMAAAFVALPDRFEALARSVSFRLCDRYAKWSQVGGSHERYDAVHAFTKSRAELVADLGTLAAAITRNGMIWISWPKKASKIATDMSEDVIREAALAGDLVDVKVAAVDEVWSGLKLVIRKERR